MTPAAIMRGAAADGVSLALTPEGSIKATGNHEAVQHWREALREHKAEIVEALKAGGNIELSEAELAILVTGAARAVGLDPLDLWQLISADDIEAIRSGDPAEAEFLRFLARSRSLSGDRTPGGHNLPFPEAPADNGPVRCCDCIHQEPTNHPALITCRAGVEPTAACGSFWTRDARHCGRFEKAEP